MAIYNIHGGHNPSGKIACGASDLLDESREDRKICKEVVRLLKKHITARSATELVKTMFWKRSVQNVTKEKQHSMYQSIWTVAETTEKEIKR